MNLTDEDVQEILKLLDQSPYDELTLETASFRLTLRPTARRAAAPANGDETIAGQPEPAIAATARPRTVPVATGETLEVFPPLPGTFYRAPSPGAEPFTEVGNSVEPDSIVGLVETMKLMNSVMAGCRGEVIEICAENAALVDVGDVLMKIRVTAHG